MTDTTLEAPKAQSPELFRSKMAMALTKAEQSTQALHDAESKLVYNEDNLLPISQFIESCKAAEKIVETERVALKEPYLQTSRNIDAGAKLVSTDLVTLRTKAHTQYSKLCMEVERKRQEAAREALRVKQIRDLMDGFKMEYSGKVADAKTSQELLEIERRINLETGNKNRYGEFLPEFVEDCKAIRGLLTAQKARVREYEELQIQAQEAAANGSDEQILELMEKKEMLEAKISENKVTIQETAIFQSANAAPITPEIILPEAPKGRQLWKWEMVDVKAATKAGLTLVIPNKMVIDDILRSKREVGVDVEEDGIRYFIELKY